MSKNPRKMKTRLIAVVPHPRDAKEVATPGRSPRKSLPEEHLFQVGIIPGGGEPLVLDPHPQGAVVLQPAEGRAAEDAEVGVGMPLPHPAPVLLERDIELPMQPILDRPVVPH